MKYNAVAAKKFHIGWLLSCIQLCTIASTIIYDCHVCAVAAPSDPASSTGKDKQTPVAISKLIEEASQRYSARDLKSAIEILKPINIGDISHQNALRVLSLRAHLLFELKQFAQSEATCRHFLRIASEPGDMAQLLSLALAHQKRINEALTTLERDIARKPTSSAYSIRASIYSMTGQPGKVGKDLDTALTLSPNDADAMVVHANACLGSGFPQKAQNSLNRAKRNCTPAQRQRLGKAIADIEAVIKFQLNSKDGGAQALLVRGLAGEKNMDDDAAYNSYTEGLKLSPRSSHLRFHRALLLAHMRRFKEALADCEVVKDNREGYHHTRMQIFRRWQNKPAALVEVNMLLKVVPPTASTLTDKTVLLMQMGRYDEADKAMVAAEKLGGDVRELRPEIYCKQKRYDEALIAVNKLIKERGYDHNPKVRDFLILRAKIYRGLDRTELAKADEDELQKRIEEVYDESMFRIKEQRKPSK